MNQLINVTEIISYLYCPRKFYLKKVKKLKEPFTKAMFLGKLKHEALDLLNKNEQTLVESITQKIEKQELNQKYQELLKKITLELLEKNQATKKIFDVTFFTFFPSLIEQAAKEIDLRVNSCLETIKLGFFGKELWKNLFPRYLTEYSLSSNQLGIKGRIDRIQFSEEIIPYELKTRSEIFESDKIQLAAYALLLEEHFSKPIKKGIVEVKNYTEEISITEELKDKVKQLIKEIQNLLEEKNKPKILENFKKCEKCSFSDECVNLQ